jgi:hypothetical protein
MTGGSLDKREQQKQRSIHTNIGEDGERISVEWEGQKIRDIECRRNKRLETQSAGGTQD